MAYDDVRVPCDDVQMAAVDVLSPTINHVASPLTTNLVLTSVSTHSLAGTVLRPRPARPAVQSVVMSASVCVCLSICSTISKTTRPNFTNFYAYCLALTRCEKLCTSGFVDDVMSSYSSLARNVYSYTAIEYNSRDFNQILLSDKDQPCMPYVRMLHLC